MFTEYKTVRDIVGPLLLIEKVTDVNEMLKMARSMEEQSAMDYNRWANECGANADSVSKKLFEDLVMDEEPHFGQFDDEAENIKRYGENYLAQQAIKRSKATQGTGGEA